MKSIYPISTSLTATKYRFSRELDRVGVEYSFMGNGSCDGRSYRVCVMKKPTRGDDLRQVGDHYVQITEVNYEFIYASIDELNDKPQLDTRSWRYRQRDAVPK